MDIFEGGSRAFHPDGLFSVETFGKVGDERRNRLFGYVDLGAKILHPLMLSPRRAEEALRGYLGG